MASGHACTALFCANDEMAVGALSYFQEAGIRVPQQLSVLGYDDTPSAEFSAPRLEHGAHAVARNDAERPECAAQ
jgi:LacI family transcriptional regulator